MQKDCFLLCKSHVSIYYLPDWGSITEQRTCTSKEQRRKTRRSCVAQSIPICLELLSH